MMEVDVFLEIVNFCKRLTRALGFEKLQPILAVGTVARCVCGF